ncbi:MAG: c-type cytochrome domain-containing protein [Flavobacteriales bacterium]
MKKNILIITLAIAAGFVACKHHPDPADLLGGGGGTDPQPWVNPDPCDPDTVYFTNTIAPLLNAYCGSSDCHDNVNPEEGINVTSYSSIMNSDDGEFVVPGDPGESKLIESLYEPLSEDEHMPPSDQTQLTSDQIALITTWINQGARNNGCTADCDTTMVPTFSGFVSPLITAACVGCHDNSNPDGNLSLTNYAQISASALDGSLMSSLTGTNGYTLMPDNTTGIPQCQIDLIQEWIDAGAQND